MSATFENYIDYLEGTIRYNLIKINFLRDEDESVLETIQSETDISDFVSGGSIKVENKNGVRRTVDIRLSNKNGKYVPSINSNVWMLKKFSVELGARTPQGDFYFPYGTYYFRNPSIDSNPEESIISIKGTDKFSALNDQVAGALQDIYVIDVGLPLRAVLETLLADADDIKDLIFDNRLEGYTIPYTIIKEQGDTYSDIILELAEALSCETYYNNNGNLVFKLDDEESTKPSIYTFTDSEDEKNYINSSFNYDFENTYNVCITIGSNINGSIANGRAENNDPTSPTSIASLGRERAFVINNDVLQNDTEAENLAIYYLKRKTRVALDGTLKSLPMFHLDAGDVIDITDNQLNLETDRFLISQINIDLGIGGDMDLKLEDVVDVDTFTFS